MVCEQLIACRLTFAQKVNPSHFKRHIRTAFREVYIEQGKLTIQDARVHHTLLQLQTQLKFRGECGTKIVANRGRTIHSFQRSSYYGRRSQQSAALIRARRPYLVKNAVLGLAIAAFAGGVYAYTIHVIGQDEFDDVKVPDAPSVQQQLRQLPPRN